MNEMFFNIQVIDWGIFLIDILLVKNKKMFYEIFLLYFICKNFLFPIAFLKNIKIMYVSRFLLFLGPFIILKIVNDISDFFISTMHFSSILYLLIIMLIVKKQKYKKRLLVIIVLYQLIFLMFYIFVALEVGEI